MPVFVALLRGVNVGKGNRVPMAGFRSLLTRLGYADVTTLLNSGNAVFRASSGTGARHAARIAAALAGELHLDVPVIVKTGHEIAAIVAGCPIDATVVDHSRLFVTFAQRPETLAALRSLEPLVAPSEQFALGRQAAYLFCPDGSLQSKAGAALLGSAGRAVTTRNWATVLKLRHLSGGAAADPVKTGSRTVRAVTSARARRQR